VSGSAFAAKDGLPSFENTVECNSVLKPKRRALLSLLRSGQGQLNENDALSGFQQLAWSALLWHALSIKVLPIT
jgi:hypothetical protein